ncbi:MAG: DUF1080 domain-containing protein [Tepidisphaeraceae bacterium]
MSRPICVALSLLLLASACASSHEERAAGKNTAAKADDGFVALFNGRDLTGWTYGAKAGEGYRVRDGGILYCTVHDGGNLFTEKQYADFVMRFAFKLTPGANNGVAIRSPLKGKLAYDGIEIQILDDTAEKYAKIRPAQFHGSIYDTVAAERGHLKPVGEWNEQEITAKGSRITIKLNGSIIVDADLANVTDEKILARHPGLKNKTGHLGFLGHGAEIEFRDIRIKAL